MFSTPTSRFRTRKAAAAFAAVLLTPLTAYPSSTDAIWIDLGADSSWLTAGNWSTNIVPNSFDSIARFNYLSGKPIAILGSSSIALSVLEMSDPMFSAVVGGTINLGGQATIFADGNNCDLPNTVFLFSAVDPSTGATGNNIGGSGSLATSIVGTLGLNKTGDSHIRIDSPQYYSGTTTISGGGKIITTVGDLAFGQSSNPISLNDGSILVAVQDWNTSRTIYVDSGGGSIWWAGIQQTVSFDGNFAGEGTLTLNGFGGSVGAGTVASANSFTGTLNVAGGTVILHAGGAFASAAAAQNSGTLILDNSVSGSSVDRLPNAASLTMRGSALSLVGSSTGYSETIGPLVLDGGVSFITVNPGDGWAQASFGNLTRNNGAGVVFRGGGLGAGGTTITLNNGTSLLVKGIIPFAYVNNNYYEGYSSPESPDNLLATYGPNGVTPITSYVSSPGTSTLNLNDNVMISSYGTVNAPGTRYCNALVLSAPWDSLWSAGTGMTLSGGTINIDSGVVLSAHAGYVNSGVFPPNSFPGNIVNANLAFGSRQAVIMTPSAITLNGVISGSGGLTKIGGRTAQFAGANTYTGTTILNGFVRFVLPTGQTVYDGTSPGPFGLDTSPIVLYGGGVSPINWDGSASGTGQAHLISNNSGSVAFNRAMELRGNAALRNIGAGTVVWGGTITLSDPSTILTFLTSSATAHMVVTGTISGPGHVVARATAEQNNQTWVDLLNANTFTGGFELSGGTVGIGHDQALGSGTVHLAASSMIYALGGARNLANPFVIINGTLSIGGSQPLTLSGPIIGRGGDYFLDVTNTATTTFAGNMTGGGFVKRGSGTLVVSGDNLFSGVLSVGDGTVAGGMVILRSDRATGLGVGATIVESGQNALALDGGITIGQELLYLKGEGINNAGALRNLSGSNTWGGIVRPTAVYSGVGTANPVLVSQSATVGVDAGTLTIDSVILGVDGGAANASGGTVFLANSIGLHKTGPGALVVGSDVISTAVGSASYNWNGAIVVTGSLDIQSGTVQIKPNSGIATIASGRSVVDVGSLNIAGGPSAPTAKLDLSSNGLVVDYSGSSPLDSIRQLIRAAYASGAWNGNGITSSLADASHYALGYGEAADLGLSSLFGDPLDSTTVIVRYTYYGDADCDGDVDNADFGRFFSHFNTPSGAVWFDGDFDYDQDVDNADFGLFFANFNNTPLPAADTLIGLASLPEPSFTLLLTVLTTTLLARRRL